MVPSKALRRAVRRACRLHHEPDPLATKAQCAAHIRELAEDGKVAAIGSGRDCDGYSWDGQVTMLPASVVAYYRLWDNTMLWADGPRSFRLARPSSVA